MAYMKLLLLYFIMRGVSSFVPSLKTRFIRNRVQPVMSYELVHSITPLFGAELTGCASVIGAGILTANTEPEIDMGVSVVEKEYDIYRDSLLRYAGYLNEIGEAFRPLVPVYIVLLSYVAALTYVSADGISKGIAAGKLTPDVPESDRKFTNSELGCTVAAAVDTLSFQLLASILFPGYIINRWVTLCGYLTHDVLDLSGLAGLAGVPMETVQDFLPTALGLALIPLIVAPLDALTEKILDNTVRPFLYTRFPPCALPFDLVGYDEYE